MYQHVAELQNTGAVIRHIFTLLCQLSKKSDRGPVWIKKDCFHLLSTMIPVIQWFTEMFKTETYEELSHWFLEHTWLVYHCAVYFLQTLLRPYKILEEVNTNMVMRVLVSTVLREAKAAWNLMWHRSYFYWLIILKEQLFPSSWYIVPNSFHI